MKELLERWATLEPKLCYYNKSLKSFVIDDSSWKHIITEDSLMVIQWEVQRAIVSRQWSFELIYNLEYEATVSRSGATSQSSAEALLGAYLKALED